MSDLPPVDGKTAIKVFEAWGFSVVRVKSSHHVMKKEGHRNLLTVPVHGAKPLKKGTLRGLIKAAERTVDDFVATLDDLEKCQVP